MKWEKKRKGFLGKHIAGLNQEKDKDPVYGCC